MCAGRGITRCGNRGAPASYEHWRRARVEWVQHKGLAIREILLWSAMPAYAPQWGFWVLRATPQDGRGDPARSSHFRR
jgi:hypothetical protein